MSFSIQSWWILCDESCQNCTLKSCIPSTGKGVEKGCGNLCYWQLSAQEELTCRTSRFLKLLAQYMSACWICLYLYGLSNDVDMVVELT